MSKKQIPLDEEVVIYPKRGKKDPIINGLVVIILVEEDLYLLTNSIESFHILKRYKLPNGTQELIYIEKEGQNVWFAGPALGAPQAVLLLEKLVAMGAEATIAFGWCGSIQPDLEIGEMIIPTSGYSEEGTSQHYPISQKDAPDPDIVKLISESLMEQNIPYKKGCIWTTDAPYRETKRKVLYLQKKGILAVEMEVSALMRVSIFRKTPHASLLIVSDKVGNLKWEPGFKNTLFRERRREILDLLFNIASQW